MKVNIGKRIPCAYYIINVANLVTTSKKRYSNEIDLRKAFAHFVLLLHYKLYYYALSII